MASTPTTRPPAATPAGRAGPSKRLAAVAAGLLTVVIALSWVLTLQQARDMDEDMAGTMGLGLVPFLVMWVPMVVAMMFPTVGPSAVVAVQARGKTLQSPRWTLGLRAGAFLLTYLMVWAAFGALVYGAVAGLDALIDIPERQARFLGAGIYAIAGLYQLTGVKDTCRERCRTGRCNFESEAAPGRLIETVRVAASHGAYCVGCCWAYMVVLIAVGMTNLVAMAGLAVVIFIERHVPRQPVIVSRVTGAVLLIMAALTPFISWLHPGLTGGSAM